MLEITLPEHDVSINDVYLGDVKYCFSCYSETFPTLVSNVYTHNGYQVRVSNIRAHKCPKCGEEIYTSGTVDRVLHAVREATAERDRILAKMVDDGLFARTSYISRDELAAILGNKDVSDNEVQGM